MAEHLGVKDKAELDFTYDFYTSEAVPMRPMPDTEQSNSNIKALSASNPKVTMIDSSAMWTKALSKMPKIPEAQTNTGRR